MSRHPARPSPMARLKFHVLSSSASAWHFVWWEGPRRFEEARQIAAEEIGAVPFKPLRGFAKLFKLGERTRSSGPPWRSHLRWHEIDLGQLPATMFKRDVGHGPVSLAGDDDEAIGRTEPDLEWVARPVSRRHHLLETQPSEKRER